MVGIIDTAKAYWAGWKFRRSALGQALAQHTHQFFYSGQLLSWMKQENKDKFVHDFYSKLITVASSPNAVMELREALANHVIVFCQLAILCLTEEEKQMMHYADNPYITGEIHHHIVVAAEHNKEAAQFVWESSGATAEELMSFANTRSALMLYYANGFNMARIDAGDTSSDKDWYKPFVEAMMVWEEDQLREKLGLPRLLPGIVDGLAYSTFLNHVTNGDRNPFYTWTKEWPRLHLGGN
jgi:hypothetical protein